jgi:hypothetical protein
MSTFYLFVNELAFISERLERVFEQHAEGAAAQISFKEVQTFQKQIRTWDRGFIKPPAALVSNCKLDLLTDFYKRKLDFSIFQRFPSPSLEAIREEIAAYAAREALDALIGCRLRNWAEVGLTSPRWEAYRELVNRHYEQTVSPEKRQRIAAFEQALAQETGKTLAEIHPESAGELFFEVDEIRLMSPRRLEHHLSSVRDQFVGWKTQKEARRRASEAPEALQDSFQLFGFTHGVDWDKLRTRYRQLAMDYHPDKGGDLEQMQRLNAAYRQMADYLRQLERERRREDAASAQ